MADCPSTAAWIGKAEEDARAARALHRPSGSVKVANDFRDCAAWRRARDLVVKLDRARKRVAWGGYRDWVADLRGSAVSLCDFIVRACAQDDPDSELCEYRGALCELRSVEGHLEVLLSIFPNESSTIAKLQAECDKCAHELGKLIEESQTRVHVQKNLESLDQ